MMSNKYRLIPLSLGVGALFGIYYEREFNNPRSYDWKELERLTIINQIRSLINLPPVHAAKPMMESDTSKMPVLSSSVLPQNRTAEIMQFGFPGLDNIRSFDNFVLSYDRRNRNAHWVFEHLKPDHVTKNDQTERSKCNFQEDNSIHKYFRATNNDFKNSGYDRGHLAAAANHRHSQNAMGQTFYLSNISPQVGKGFNRDIWNGLEKYVRGIVRKNKNVYVCTGPLYLPRTETDGKMYVKYQVIGLNNIAVPTHFFKVILIENNNGQFELLSYILPNKDIPDNTPLKYFLAPIDAIERAAGFLLFDKLPRDRLKYINFKKV